MPTACSNRDQVLNGRRYHCLLRFDRDGKSKKIYWSSDISPSIYQYVRYIERNISTYSIYQKKYIDRLFFPKKTPILSSHLVSHRIDIFYLLDSLSKLTRIITYLQTREHEKLITTFFTGYFPSTSICHKKLRFCWKLLWTIIYSVKRIN